MNVTNGKPSNMFRKNKNPTEEEELLLFKKDNTLTLYVTKEWIRNVYYERMDKECMLRKNG